MFVRFLALDRKSDSTDRWPTSSVTEAAPGRTSTPNDLVTDRVSGVVEIAGEFDTGVKLETLVDLLPEHGPATVSDLRGWIQAHPGAGRISGERVVGPERPDFVVDGERHQRAERYYQAAVSLFASAFPGTRPLLRCVAVTGSTAYGDPRAGDDCDLMAVVRPGSVWVFITYAFLRLRLRRWVRPIPTEPEWCLNYVLDEDTAIQEFSRPRGFLFAREALVARPVEGEAYYRGLLDRGEWMRHEAPGLYARWRSGSGPASALSEPAPGAIRIINALLFPVLATYLQFKGLWTNLRLRRAGREGETFRTITRPGRMALASRKFERLAARMAPANRAARE